MTSAHPAETAEEAVPSQAGTGTRNSEAEDRHNALWAQAQSSGTFRNWEELVVYTLKTVADLTKTRPVLDAFLARYPLCYGYWQKYAEAEVAGGDEAAARQVYERGIAATPYSQKLWLSYAGWLQRLYERAAQYLSIEWTAHSLFDHWAVYEQTQLEQGSANVRRVVAVLGAAVALPLKDLSRRWEAFMAWTKDRALLELVSEDLVPELTQEAKKAKAKQTIHASSAAGETSSLKANQEEAAKQNVPQSIAATHDASADALKAKEDAVPLEEAEISEEDLKAAWMARHQVAHAAALAAAKARSGFEGRIRRRWWSPNPMPAEELLAWSQYLDAVHASGDEQQLYGCFERCLVPCANYPEVWIRYMDFALRASSLPGADQVLDYALSRATTVFCPSRYDLLAAAALARESQGNADAATKLLEAPFAPAVDTHAAGHSEAQCAAASEPKLVTGGTVPAAARSIELAARRAGLRRRCGAAWVDIAAPLTQLVDALDKPGDEKAQVLAVQLLSAFAHACSDAPATSQGLGADQEGNNGGAGLSEGGHSKADARPWGQKADGRYHSVQDVVAGLVARRPGSLRAWRAAAAALELAHCEQPQRAEDLLKLYKSALEARVPDGKSDAHMDGEAFAAGVSYNGAHPIEATASQQRALPLASREALAASATMAMELYGTVEQLLAAHALTLSLHSEAVESAVTAYKRTADWQASGQPDPKRLAPDLVAGMPHTGGGWAPLPQHPYAYNYAPYYQQQGYYGYGY